MNKINIISFDVPYPPNYGGAIDVFFKIKALSKLGIQITLHTYEYGRGEHIELEELCEKVYYYKRKHKLSNYLNKLPYIVKSRDNNLLTERLKENNYPILFEGLHTTFPLLKENFNERITIIRTHNIEHDYYNNLYLLEQNFIKKIFFKTEVNKLRMHETILTKVDHILAIAPFEYEYFKKKYPNNSVSFVGAFHENKKVDILQERGEYLFFHGNLKIEDNNKAAHLLVDLFSKTDLNLVIASDFIDTKLENKINTVENVKHQKINDFKNLKLLFDKAQVNLLPTFQKNGIKLKLINTLYNSKFCIANSKMISVTGLEDTCIMNEFDSSIVDVCKQYMLQSFSDEELQKRKKVLAPFDTIQNAKKIIELISC